MAKPKKEEVLEEVGYDDDSLDVIELDTNLDESPEPELLPAGFYLAEVADVQKRTNQKGTGQYYAVKFVIPTDQYPANYDLDNWPDGLTLYYNLLRVPSAGDRRSISTIRRFIETLGLPTDTNKIDPSQWMGRRARLKVEHSTYEGNTRESIARNGVHAAE